MSRAVWICVMALLVLLSPLNAACAPKTSVWRTFVMLRELGYDVGFLLDDTARLKKHIKCFQEQHDLDVTGEISYELMKALAGEFTNRAMTTYFKIFEAARHNDAAAVSAWAASGGKLNPQNGLGETPLHTAVRNGNREAARELVRNGAGDYADFEGNTPIMIAAARGDTNMVMTLLMSGSNPLHKNSQGVDAVDLALAAGHVQTAEAIMDLMSADAQTLRRLGKSKDPSRSIPALYQLNRLERPNGEAYDLLGKALQADRMHQNAVLAYESSMFVDPHYASANPGIRYRLAVSYYVIKDHAAALKSLREGLESHPHDGKLLTFSAWILATSRDGSIRDGPEALRLARKAASTGDPRYSALAALAAAHAENGDFDSAVSIQERAIAKARQSGISPGLIKAYEKRLADLRQGAPVRQ